MKTLINKKSILLLTAIMFASVSHAQWWGGKKVKGNGNMTTETRTPRIASNFWQKPELKYHRPFL